MMIEGCRGMSGALFCLAQGRGQEGQGNLKSSWREGAGENAKRFEGGGARAQAMMPGNMKWREGVGNDAEEVGAQPLSADCVAARRCFWRTSVVLVDFVASWFCARRARGRGR